ncbi:MAG: ABC transporter ATP-binding protein [Anaerolineaceae bacterium]|nr:ABC transporter ATP-binding protein [Anaerolineaceae bacterium]
MKPNLIEFQDITFGYRTEDGNVLKSLSLQIPSQSVTIILGPNGVGKTTLLNLLLGWQKPQSGSILLDEQPLMHYSRRELGKRIALVPQRETFTFSFTLLEYVLLGRAPHMRPLDMPSEADIEICMQALEQVGMAELAERPITDLSGGEQQLVLVARALAQGSRILLMDEPTSHLDLKNKLRFVRMVRNLVKNGHTLLITTHEPEVAAAVADYVVLLMDGSKAQAGPAEDMLNDAYLSETYGIMVRTAQADGKKVILWDNDEGYDEKQ